MENRNFNEKQRVVATLQIEGPFIHALPQDFINDPFGYFEKEGNNIKPGEISYKPDGMTVSDDPTAVKELPEWRDAAGASLYVVAKKVNLDKSMIHKSNNPRYEYDMIKLVRSKGLPAALPIGFVSLGAQHLMLTEKIKGLPWNGTTLQTLKDTGYTDDEIVSIEKEAIAKMHLLQKAFEAAGIQRKWELKDMVIEINEATREVLGVTPTDWEKTRYE